MIGRRGEARILRAVEWAERQMQAGSDRPGRAAPASYPLLFARVTSSTRDANGHYPAVITQPTEPNGWEDSEFACKLRLAAGGSAAKGNRYPCRPGHGNSDGEDVYVAISSGDAVPGVSGCDLAGLMTTDCLYAVGPLGWTYLRYVSDSAGVRWVGDSDLFWADGTDEPHGALVFWFAGGVLHLSLDGSELAYCGDGCWRGGELTGHIANNGTLGLDDCEGQVFTVCLSCSCCPIAGWLGEGWYCADIGSGCVPLYLTEADKCDNSIAICSGPYPAESAAEAVCGTGGGITMCCGDGPGDRPIVTSGAWSAGTDEGACLDAVVVTQTGPTDTPTQMTGTGCDTVIGFELSCVGGIYVMTPTAAGQTWVMMSGDATTQVWLLTVDPGTLTPAGAGGTATLTLTGTFPQCAACCDIFRTISPPANLCVTLYSTDIPSLNGVTVNAVGGFSGPDRTYAGSVFLPIDHATVPNPGCGGSDCVVAIDLNESWGCKVQISITCPCSGGTTDVPRVTLDVVSCDPLCMRATATLAESTPPAAGTGAVTIVISDYPCAPGRCGP